MNTTIHHIPSPEELALEQILSSMGDRNKIQRILKEIGDASYEAGYAAKEGELDTLSLTGLIK